MEPDLKGNLSIFAWQQLYALKSNSTDRTFVQALAYLIILVVIGIKSPVSKQSDPIKKTGKM